MRRLSNETFLIFVFLHFLLDWSLQDEMTKQNKSKYNIVLAVHCIIWSFGISIALMYFDLFAWWKVAMLFVGHYAMDYWKCKGLYKKWPVIHDYSSDAEYDKMIEDGWAPNGRWEDGIKWEKFPISDITSLYIDQIFHLGQVFICLIF